jgi:protein Tex
MLFKMIINVDKFFLFFIDSFFYICTPKKAIMELKYIQQIATKQSVKINQVESVAKMNGEGATIPFMARYRKEATGNLDEVFIGNIVEDLKYYTELEKRKETILKTIQELGKLTPELEKRITDCMEATVLEDIYLSYKPKRKTKAVMAIEKGLEPLAKNIFELNAIDIDVEATKYINENVKDTVEALQGARDIIAEWVAENEQARNKIRQLFNQYALLTSKVLTAKKEEEEAQKYRDYFEFSEQLSKSPSHRILAIRRAEKEGYLSMSIGIEKEMALTALQDIFLTKHNEAAKQVELAIEDSYNRLLKTSIETEFRLQSKNMADEEAIKVFTENLKQLLLSSPLGAKRILALDPGFRTGCKLVCLDEQGALLYNTTIYPHPPQNEIDKTTYELKHLVNKYNIDAIAIGNGTAGRESEQLVRSIDFGKTVSVFQVNESGASIYSASEVAREEFPDQDITVRGSVSIGRRLLDPLSELVKIDAKSIGVGQYQHDVNQIKLKDSLDRVVESCVNHVGVNLNTASKHLLMYVSGLSATLAKNIVEYRNANGAFKTREALKKVSLMGPKSYEQCAGFLRIPNADNILDSSAVHPETYSIVEQMAKDLNASIETLVKDATVRKQVVKQKYITETVGEYTINDILKELEKPGLDPRQQIEEFQYDATIKKIEDVKVGMKVPGIVTNITNFGAFVDIGVKQDGLVHISQITNKFITDPNEVLKLQQKVMVTITEVDVTRKRIALTMKDGANNGQPQQRSQSSFKPSVKKETAEPLNDFQAKLMALKSKFKD